MTRKSARTRKPNPKFQDGTISSLADAFGSDSEPDPYYLPKLKDSEKGDDDFDVREAAVDAVAQRNDDDGNLSLSEADAAGASDASDAASPVENSDADDVLSDSTDDPTRATRHAERLARTRREYASILHADSFHSRGYPDSFKQNTGKEDHWKLTFGAAKEDTKGIIKSRDRWTDVGSITFPSKAALREVVQEEVAQDRAGKCIGWYDREEGFRFRKRQRVERLDPAEGKTYLPLPDPGKEDGHSLLMGPLNAQRVFHLPVGQSMNLADAWPRVPGFRPVREGWFWNVGRGAQTLSWAPLPPQSTKQYLALGVPSSTAQKSDFMAKNPEWEKQSGASAFVPAAPTKACIQVWEFVSKKGRLADDGASGNEAYGEEDVLNVPDMTVKPRLRLAIATEWGDVRRLQWCPAYPAQTPDGAVGHGEASSCLGLLAGLWGDGRARVIEVQLGDDGRESEYIHLLQAPFESIPPESIFTALTWFSAAELGLGTAHGAVSVFNIPICSSLPAPKPFFYHQIHSSYILAIAPALPDFPHLLASSSMDGFTYLTDLRDPSSDKSSSHRSRLATAHIQYLAPIRCMIQSEESEFIKILPLRRFFSNNNAAKASASVTSLATSPLHPCTLAGAADGTVIGTNPTRRALSHKAGQYQQCWFAHDYSPTGGEAGDGHSMSRILDGFKAEKSNMHKVTSHTGTGDTAWATTWEEGGHITALAWNWNIECGGWAAASMGSGLMRMEDVSI